MFDPRSAVAPLRAVNPVQSTITAFTLPEAGESVQAGFPSPAQDFWSGDLDLSEHLIRDRTSTFIVRAVGSSMGRPGIFDGERLIVYRAITRDMDTSSSPSLTGSSASSDCISSAAVSSCAQKTPPTPTSRSRS